MVENLSSSPRRHWFAGLLAGAALAGLGMLAGMGLSGSRSAGPTIIEASQFRVVDEDGTVRGRWSAWEGKCAFDLLDDEGKARLRLLIDEHPRIQISGPDGKLALVVDQHPDNGTEFWLLDQDGKTRLSLYARTSAAAVQINDADEKARIEARCSDDSDPELKVNGPNERPVWIARPE